MQGLVNEANVNGHDTANLHWDDSRCLVQVFGDDAAKDFLRERLAALAAELAGFVHEEVPCPATGRKTVQQNLERLQGLPGVASAQLLG